MDYHTLMKSFFHFMLATIFLLPLSGLSSHHIVYYPKAINSPKGEEQDKPMLIEEPRKTVPLVPVPMVIKPPIALRIPIAWDYQSNALVEIENFRIYSGPSRTNYTTNTLAGKVLTNSFPWMLGTKSFVAVTSIANGFESDFSNELLIPAPFPSNTVITVTSTMATNLQWSQSLSGPWTKIGATNWSQTNPPPLFWRAMGRSSTSQARAYISRRLQ